MIDFLKKASNLRWARDVHCLPAYCRSCMIYGNKDAPERIEGYRVSSPFFDERPACILTFDELPDGDPTTIIVEPRDAGTRPDGNGGRKPALHD